MCVCVCVCVCVCISIYIDIYEQIQVGKYSQRRTGFHSVFTLVLFLMEV